MFTLSLKYVVSPPSTSSRDSPLGIPNDPLGVPQSIDVWYEIRAVSADPTYWRIMTVLTLVPATGSHQLGLVTKCLKCRGPSPRGAESTNLYSPLWIYVGNSCSVWFSSCLKEINSSPMKKRKFQEFQECLVHETGKWSTMDKKISVKKGQGKRPETLAMLYQPWSHSLPHKACFLLFQQLLSSIVQISFN